MPACLTRRTEVRTRPRRGITCAALVAGLALGAVAAPAHAATPTVRITAPANYATVSGKIVFTAAPSNGTPTSIDFYVDGVKRWTEKSSPYRYNDDSGYLDTAQLSNGSHKLAVKGYFSGGKTAGATVQVFAQNAATTQATPLWNGDSFTINPYGTFHGGEGALPPYQWSSASGPGGGWYQPHSNTNPSAHGVTVVSDPTGLGRPVIRLNADERLYYTNYVRDEIRGPLQLGPGMDRWVIAEMFVPTDTPTIPTASAWWTVLSIFGPPYKGASQNSFQMNRNAVGTGNDITWETPTGAILWRTPAIKGVWHIVARRIKFSSDATQGFSEIWYSQRDAAGKPTGPLVQQTLSGGVKRRYYKTLDPNINWDGHTLNHADLKNYHSSNMWPGRNYTPLDFARFRIYDGTTPVREIDPYYTGLK